MEQKKEKINFLKLSKIINIRYIGYIRNLIVFFEKIDIYNKCRYEYCIRLDDKGINNNFFQFIYLDGKGYSYKDSRNFLYRLSIYKKIIIKYTHLINNIFFSLSLISKIPLDLYFGQSICSNNTEFSLWLVLGGMKKGKILSHCNKSNQILDILSLSGNIRGPNDIILNIGFHFLKKQLFFEIYYLYNEINEYNIIFNTIISIINSIFYNELEYFYFYSLKYENKQIVCRSLFLEFLGCNLDMHSSYFERLIVVLKGNGILRSSIEQLASIGGEISMISFNERKEIYFYLRD